jgi:uncharacterized protein (DUF362 family)
VVLSRDSSIFTETGSVDPDRLLTLIDGAIQTYCSSDSPEEAWRCIVRPGQVVGLKVNCLAGKGMSTHIELVHAISERLQSAGISVQDIVVWDRLNRDLESAGFPILERGSGVRYFGNDFLGYENDLSVSGSVGSLLSRTLTQVCDVVINLPVPKDHGITGVTGALKNLFGAIHNPNKYHLNLGDPYIPDLWMISAVRAKVKLNICDALVAQYNGGPSFMPHWAWNYGGLLVSEDPVALDRIVWDIVESKRQKEGFRSLADEGREPIYIGTAADRNHRLGSFQREQIQLIEV